MFGLTNPYICIPVSYFATLITTLVTVKLEKYLQRSDSSPSTALVLKVFGLTVENQFIWIKENCLQIL